MAADEADVFEALVASERVGEWVQEACGGGGGAARAAAELAAACADSGVYAEEAAAEDAPGALRAAAEATHDAALAAALRSAAERLDASVALHAGEQARVITCAFCSCAVALTAATLQASLDEFALPNGASLRLRQSGRVADGLGGRVWGAAPLLMALLGGDGEVRAALAAARSVLELGAGAGLVGLAARRLGAARVALTDAGAPQLALLRANAALNTATEPTNDGDDEHAERDGVRVRHLDWSAPLDTRCGGDGTPALGCDERFGFVVAADVMYERAHADDVACALAARLERTAAARALLVCPVRCGATAAAFEARAAALGLHCARQALAGGAAPERYEGGYARFDLRWAQPEPSQAVS